ncbi:hypothetical protein DRO59_08595 [Candidatus Bathyarchaeota archaeon]|nr:MAG: hypothetical protein DRO59_08595 [Candidatus Bathyarchaeota archaeon]
MIKEVYLFTNRNVIVFDEKGEQVIDVQREISWDVEWYKHENEEKALEKIIKDQPKIYLARWRQWAEEITIDEFCSLLGHGRWYWEHYKRSPEAQDKTEDEEISV